MRRSATRCRLQIPNFGIKGMEIMEVKIQKLFGISDFQQLCLDNDIGMKHSTNIKTCF